MTVVEAEAMEAMDMSWLVMYLVVACLIMCGEGGAASKFGFFFFLIPFKGRKSYKKTLFNHTAMY